MTTYETQDMQLAAYLVANGGPFPKVERTTSGRPVFVFADNDEGQVAWDAEQYQIALGGLMVNVRHLWKGFDELKRALGPKSQRH